MKRLILSVVAALAVAGPITATATSAAAQSHWDGRDGRHDGRGDRYDNRGRGDGRWDRNDNRGRGGGDWDRGHHNGYYYNNRWYYGPPPQAYYGNPYYRPGYAAWRRGGELPPYYRGYVVNDYYRYRLRPPPRGYAWYRAGNDYVLAAITTGIIFDIINN
jgi:Ni/Co efflux regulator RcnB